jgi:hypothetical protein
MKRSFSFALIGILFGLFVAIPVVQGEGFTVTSKSVSGDLPLDPRSSDWEKAPAMMIPLSSQIIFTPRAFMTPLGRSSVRQVEVKSLHNAKQIAIRLEWADLTDDSHPILEDTPKFRDAAAVEFPAPGGKELPYFGMGNESSPVNIWQWKSELENGQALRAIPLGDSYAGESLSNIGRSWYDGLWTPLSPPRDRERTSPVEDLIAVGFSTLSLQDSQDVMGKGIYNPGKWSVVFLRDLQTKDKEDVVFTKGSTVPIAFAIWDGNNEERDGLKSISTWHDLKIE